MNVLLEQFMTLCFIEYFLIFEEVDTLSNIVYNTIFSNIFLQRDT